MGPLLGPPTGPLWVLICFWWLTISSYIPSTLIRAKNHENEAKLNSVPPSLLSWPSVQWFVYSRFFVSSHALDQFFAYEFSLGR